MNKIRKLFFFILFFSLFTGNYVCAEDKKTDVFDSETVKILNDAGNNDAIQEGSARIGKGLIYGGLRLQDTAWKYGRTNTNIAKARIAKMVKTGVQVFKHGQMIEKAATVAPHVGWIASTAGKLDAKDYTGAAISATNGLARTTAIGWIGTTVGGLIVVGATATAPVVITSVAVGCGAAWLGGKIWDYTIGHGADVLDQKVHNIKAQLKYGQTPLSSAQRNIRRLKWIDKKDTDTYKGEDKKKFDAKKKNQKIKRREEKRKQAEKIRKKVKAQLAKKEKEKRKLEEAKKRFEKQMAKRKKEENERRKKRRAKKLLEQAQKRAKAAKAEAARKRLKEKIERFKKENLLQEKKKYADMSASERHKALKNGNDEAWTEMANDLMTDLGLTEEQEEKIAQLTGVISGGWAGKDKHGWKVKGTFRMRIRSSGSVSGKYSGDDSGSLGGFINSSGTLDVKSGGGSVSGGKWHGSIRKTESGGLVGSGSWAAEGYHGGWRGSGR